MCRWRPARRRAAFRRKAGRAARLFVLLTVLIDATGMARADEIARVAVGRDAVDIAFMTIFGRAKLQRQSVRVARLA